MKKLLIILLALIMVFSFAACGGGDEGDEPAGGDEVVEPEGEGGEDEGEAGDGDSASDHDWSNLITGKYADIMTKNSYYMEYTGYVMGFEMACKMATDGENNDTIASVFGMDTRTMTLDGMYYEIDDVNKKYTEGPVDPAMAAAAPADYEELKFNGSGNGQIQALVEAEVDTNSYDYDEYFISMDMESISEGSGVDLTEMDADVILRFYHTGDDLYAIVATTMGIDTVMVITELSEDIPAGMLEIPAGYEKVDSLY